ncbi:uncharacterized protein Bet1 isoform X2 [Palaemon carinicauda]|uniref:uncharacterized protein Bet1 isoform X2 n=1 Tax=Palaemon carinicauda TaxID=392227 RepID=UPI0035B6A87A
MASWGGAEENELDNRNQQRTFALSGKISTLRSICSQNGHQPHHLGRSNLLHEMEKDMSVSASHLFIKFFEDLQKIISWPLILKMKLTNTTDYWMEWATTSQAVIV